MMRTNDSAHSFVNDWRMAVAFTGSHPMAIARNAKPTTGHTTRHCIAIQPF